MIESRSMCNGCAECIGCGRIYRKYKALICDYCHGEVEWAYFDEKTGDHICEECLPGSGVLGVVREEDLNNG